MKKTLKQSMAKPPAEAAARAGKHRTKAEANAPAARDLRSGEKVGRDAPHPDRTADRQSTGRVFAGAGRTNPAAPDRTTLHQSRMASPDPLQIQIWPIDRFVLYARNPRKNDAAVDRMCASIREFGFKVPVLARSNG